MSFTDWPGVGDIPEAEDPGLREELIEKEAERREENAEKAKSRSDELKDFYAGVSDHHPDEDVDATPAPTPAPKPAPKP